MTHNDDNMSDLTGWRLDVPQLSDAAMSRVEAAMRRELDAVYPSVESAPAAPVARKQRTALFTFGQLTAMAAMLTLVFILAWHVSSPTRLSPPTDPRLAGAQPRVVEEFRIYIESSNDAKTSSPLDAVFSAVDRYESLIGVDRYARRDVRKD